MAEFHYMDMHHPYQYQQPYHPGPPALYPQQLSANHYYYPQHLPPPPEATLYPGILPPSAISPPNARTVAPMPAPPSRRPSRQNHHSQNQPLPPQQSAPIEETSSPESHCAFTFGWDFTQPDEAELDSQPEYTPSPQSSTSSSGKRQKMYEPQDMRRASVPDRVHSGRAPSSRRTVMPSHHPHAPYPGSQRTPLSDHAYGVIMQVVEGNHEPPEPQPLSDLHRRLFPPNCHITYQ